MIYIIEGPDGAGKTTLVEQIRKSNYNAVVKQFNTKCEMFPSNIIASIFHFERKPMFEVQSEEERQNVEVKF